MSKRPLSRRKTAAPHKSWPDFMMCRTRLDLHKTVNKLWRDVGEQQRSEKFVLSVSKRAHSILPDSGSCGMCKGTLDRGLSNEA